MAELEIKPTAAAQMRIAVVFLSAVALAGLLVFLLSGGGRDSFAPKASISTYMPDTTGLARNSEVRLGGIRVGKVTKVDISGSLDPQRAVLVEMKVTARFLKAIPRDSQTSVGADTLVGYRFVNIDAGKNPLYLADGGTLRSEPLKRAADRADLIRTFQTELRQADDLLIQISSGNTQIGHFVMGDKEYNDFLKQISDLERAMHSFVSPDSVVGEALFSNRMYAKIREPLLRADASLAAIQRGEGAGGRLFASDEQYNQFVKKLRDLRAALAEVNAGKGKLGPLLQDDRAYREARKMLASTDALLNSLHAGEGNIGQLLRNPEIYESLAGSLRSMQELLADIQKDPQKYLRYKVF